MKIKLLSFAIFSSLFLTACGGDDASSSDYNGSNPNTSADQQWTGFIINVKTNASNQEILGYEQDVLTLKDGKAYSKHTNTLYENAENDSSFMVTQDGVYEDGDVDATYGVLTGTATINGNLWTLTPHSKIGSSGLKFYHTYKTIDISGKSFNQVIEPFDVWALKNDLTDRYPVNQLLQNFYVKNKDLKFPSGSTCLQLIQEEVNQDYIELQNSTENDVDVKKTWNTLALSNSGAEKKTYKDTTAYVSYDYDEADTFAKYKDKFFSGNYYEKGIEFNYDDMIKELNDSTSGLTGQDLVIVKEYIEAAKNMCMIYNQTAAKTIQTTIQNFK